MGLLYENYASPNELINRMLKVKKFSKFVEHIVDRRNEEAEKEEDNRLWLVYVLSRPSVSFAQWKQGLQNDIQETATQQSQPKQKRSSLSMTDAEVEATKNKARDILKGFKI